MALVGGALWGMMLLGYYGLVHRPLVSSSSARQVRINTLERQLQGHTNVQASHQQLQAKLRELRSQIDTIRRRVPDHSLVAEFLSDATRIAQEGQLAIHHYRRNATHQFDDYSEVEVMIQGHGSYESICRFLHQVNQLDRLSTIRQMEIELSTDSNRYPFEVHYALQFGMKTATKFSLKEGVL